MRDTLKMTIILLSLAPSYFTLCHYLIIRIRHQSLRSIAITDRTPARKRANNDSNDTHLFLKQIIKTNICIRKNAFKSFTDFYERLRH